MDGNKPNFCANAVWYGYHGHKGIKSRLVRLVGWEAQKSDSVLHSCVAYDVAYETIYDALPDCKHGGCFC